MTVKIDQPFGIGDILFISPLVRLFSLQYDKIVWPVIDKYIWIKDYIQIPNVTFIKQSESVVFDSTIPFKDSLSYVHDAVDCMESKYKLLDADLNIWRQMYFDRNYKKENELRELLDIKPNDEFIFINNNFAEDKYNYKIDINVNTDLRIIKQNYIDGFTLLDWCGVLEQANEIHTVSTALFYIIEFLKLDNLHLYPRKPFDKDLSPIKSLLVNSNWICHE